MEPNTTQYTTKTTNSTSSLLSAPTKVIKTAVIEYKLENVLGNVINNTGIGGSIYDLDLSPATINGHANIQNLSINCTQLCLNPPINTQPGCLKVPYNINPNAVPYLSF